MYGPKAQAALARLVTRASVHPTFGRALPLAIEVRDWATGSGVAINDANYIIRDISRAILRNPDTDISIDEMHEIVVK